MLFNLQGAHRFQRRAFILPQRPLLVKHFFQAFSNSFALSFADPSPGFAALSGQPNYITTFIFLCQALFSSFCKLFRALSRKTFVVALPSQTAYRGYHCRNHLSSTFFRFFNRKGKRRTDWIPLRNPQTLLSQGFQTALPEALAYNSKIPSACQHLFSSFLIFFHILCFLVGFS